MLRRSPWLTVLCALPLLFTAACGGDPAAPSGAGASGAGGSGGGGAGGTGGAGGGAPAGLSITWIDCNLYTEGPTAPAKCGITDAPLHWDDPAGKRLTLSVKRLPAKGKRRGSLWLLDGGPGGGGVGLEGIADLLSKHEDGLDIYIPIHRGTGLSSKLTCSGNAPGSEAGIQITSNEWPTCVDELKAQWGKDLGAFSTTEAARDVHGLIAAEKQAGEDVFVLGASYGTYLANRYLAIDPTQATAVILDSICPPDDCHLDDFDVLYDEVGAQVLALCGAEADCAAQVGTDPRQRLIDLYASLDAGHCPTLVNAGLDRRTLRIVLAVMLNDINFRRAIPGMIKRVERCDAADYDAVIHAVQGLFGRPTDPPSAFLKAWSFPLSDNITFSELWTDPPPKISDLVAAADATVISEGVSLDAASQFPLWPRYPHDEYFGKWGKNELPMLMMNGDLDPATPIKIAGAAKSHFDGPHQTFVVMPRAPHNALLGGPIDHEGGACGIELVAQFLADPRKPLDTSCLAQVLPMTFAENPTLAQLVFGTDSLYDNP